MSLSKEYIFYQFEDSFKVIKLSVLGDYITENKKDLIKNCEAMLQRIFPEKSQKKIINILICNEDELLSKISEMNRSKI